MTEDDKIRAETLDAALDWALRTGDPGFEDWEGFTLWLGENPAHSRAYDTVSAAVAEGAERIASARPANDDALAAPQWRRAAPPGRGSAAPWPPRLRSSRASGCGRRAAAISIGSRPRPARSAPSRSTRGPGWTLPAAPPWSSIARTRASPGSKADRRSSPSAMTRPTLQRGRWRGHAGRCRHRVRRAP